MGVILCPGIHDPTLTQNFLAGMGASLINPLVFPIDRYPPYSVGHILQFLQHHQLDSHALAEPDDTAAQATDSLVFIAFSAGVVGAIGAARLWCRQGGQVKALIALDGWGVPLYGPFPIHRMSHDSFTHWSSSLLEHNQPGFYADPAVPHLELWRSPQTADGWQVSAPARADSHDRPWPQAPTRTTAATYLTHWLMHYGELSQ